MGIWGYLQVMAILIRENEALNPQLWGCISQNVSQRLGQQTSRLLPANYRQEKIHQQEKTGAVSNPASYRTLAR